MSEKLIFGKWLDRQTIAQFEIIRKRILSECKVTPQAFSQWKTGKTIPSPLAQDVINKIAMEETGASVFKEVSINQQT